MGVIHLSLVVALHRPARRQRRQALGLILGCLLPLKRGALLRLALVLGLLLLKGLLLLVALLRSEAKVGELVVGDGLSRLVRPQVDTKGLLTVGEGKLAELHTVWRVDGLDGPHAGQHENALELNARLLVVAVVVHLLPRAL